MPNISQIQIANTNYDIKDVEARTKIELVTEDSRNLWGNPVYLGNGVTITENADGSVHITGTATTNIYADYYFSSSLLLADYAISCRKTGTGVPVQVCTRNQGNTGTTFLQFNEAGDTYKEAVLTSFSPYRCEIVLFSGITYNCDLYIQLESGDTVTPYCGRLTAIDSKARLGIDNVGKNDVMEYKMKNYKEIIKINQNSVVDRWGLSSGSIDHIASSIRYRLSTAANGGFFIEAFETSSFVLQNTRLSFDLTIAQGSGIKIYLYGKDKTSGIDNAFAVGSVYGSSGHYDVDLDFAFYDVYTTLNTSKPIRILITNNGDICDFTISNLLFSSLITAQNYMNPYDEATLHDVLNNIYGSIPERQADFVITSPDGTKWKLAIANDGTISANKVAPNKSIFIGNSLLKGWSTFGMAASDIDHDYYSYVTEKIHDLNSSATYSRVSNGNLEHSTNDSDFTTAFNVIKPYLTSDLDLVCIQLGDNVNTDAKVTQFEKSGGSFETIVSYIKTNCPNARIIWIGTWYLSIHDWLVTACSRQNIEFVDILPLSTNGNKAKLGDVVTRTENYSQTLTGTYTVFGNSLRLSITLYGRSYTVVIPSYTSISSNGDGTFTMNAPYTVIDSTGVQSHPNDDGMLAIANAIMKKIGIE